MGLGWVIGKGLGWGLGAGKASQEKTRNDEIRRRQDKQIPETKRESKATQHKVGRYKEREETGKKIPCRLDKHAGKTSSVQIRTKAT